MYNRIIKIIFLLVLFIILFTSNVFAQSNVLTQYIFDQDPIEEPVEPILDRTNTAIRIFKIIKYLSILSFLILVPLGVLLISKKKRILGIILILLPILGYIVTTILTLII